MSSKIGFQPAVHCLKWVSKVMLLPQNMVLNIGVKMSFIKSHKNVQIPRVRGYNRHICSKSTDVQRLYRPKRRSLSFNSSTEFVKMFPQKVTFCARPKLPKQEEKWPLRRSSLFFCYCSFLSSTGCSQTNNNSTYLWSSSRPMMGHHP